MKVLIAGITGLLGRSLARELSPTWTVYGLTRGPLGKSAGLPEGVTCFLWDGKVIDEPLEEVFRGRYAVVNLTGEPIAHRRWSGKQVDKILKSRTLPVKGLIGAIERAKNPPEIFLQASATGIYGYSDQQVFTEKSPEGEGVLPLVAQKWEDYTRDQYTEGFPLVFLRTGIVLSNHGGALPEMIKPLKMYMGAVPGKGKQWVSWIHIQDHVRAMRFILENKEPVGPCNFTAPNPVTMQHLLNSAARIMNKPLWGNIPQWVIKQAMGVRGEEILLNGAQVMPEKIMKKGFSFRFNKVEDALENLLKK